MYLFIVRHGEPDYTEDKLTETGRKQAEMTAERLMIDRIDEIHASPLGRAKETASFLASKVGLSVITEPWARELENDCRGSIDGSEPVGIGVFPSTYLLGERFRKMTCEEAVSKIPGLCDNAFPNRYREIGEGIDEMLSGLGYERTEDGFYQPEKPDGRHIALFCHGAMIRSVLSHIYQIPYPYLGSTFHENFCGVTILRFDSDTGGAFVPKLIAFGDIGHLYKDGEAPRFYLDGDSF